MRGSGIAVPLNCVDKCELALDDIDEPALIHAIITLEGEVDDVRLARAIRTAQQAHPVMRSASGSSARYRRTSKEGSSLCETCPHWGM